MDASASSERTELVQRAAVDLTTAWGADSFFRFALTDPWADECIANFIDVLVNHRSVAVPLPSKRALQELDRDNFPACVQEAYARELLHLKTDESADVVELTHEKLADEYIKFHDSCLEHPRKVRDMVRFHRQTPEILGQHTKHVPSRAVNVFWPTRPKDDLAERLNISADYINYAFDVYARTIQYHGVLQGEAWYFRHPFRQTAIGKPDSVESIRCTLWGRCLLDGIRQGFIEHDLQRLLDIVASLRAASGDSNWYTLASEPDRTRIQAMHDIAESCHLPGKVKDSVLRTLRVSVGTGVVGAGLLSGNVGLVTLGIGAVAAGVWKGGGPSYGV